MGQEEWGEVEKKKFFQPSVDNCLSMTGNGEREKKGTEGGKGEKSLRCCVLTEGEEIWEKNYNQLERRDEGLKIKWRKERKTVTEGALNGEKGSVY